MKTVTSEVPGTDAEKSKTRINLVVPQSLMIRARLESEKTWEPKAAKHLGKVEQYEDAGGLFGKALAKVHSHRAEKEQSKIDALGLIEASLDKPAGNGFDHLTETEEGSDVVTAAKILNEATRPGISDLPPESRMAELIHPEE